MSSNYKVNFYDLLSVKLQNKMRNWEIVKEKVIEVDCCFFTLPNLKVSRE